MKYAKLSRKHYFLHFLSMFEFIQITFHKTATTLHAKKVIQTCHMHFSTNQDELNAHNLQIEKAPSIEATSCADKTHICRVLRMPPANPVV